MAFYTVQNLSCPAEGSRLVVGTTYTFSFYNPYPMYISDWNAAEDNKMMLYVSNGEDTRTLKVQTVVTGNNVLTFNLADYGLSTDITMVAVQLNVYIYPNGSLNTLYMYETPEYPSVSVEYGTPIFYGVCGEPSSPALAVMLSRDAVELSWGAGSAGTGNSVTGYDVQYADSTDGSGWGSWQTVSGSPVTGTNLSVSPPETVGHYRRFRVRTRGSAGESYYSGWVTSTNMLRRKWNAFGAWTDAPLTARTSMIRSVYLTEIQTRVNTIRTFYGLTDYGFTVVTARTTKLGRWAALIQEIRTAIDGVTTSHEAWNTLEVGKPRIAHITQIRRILDEM